MTVLRLTIPSSGALFEGSQNILTRSGLEIQRASARKYIATIPSLPGVQVLFQRQSDIPIQIDQETTDLGIVGKDRFFETRLEEGHSTAIIDNLEFGNANLVIAVPDFWLDVVSTKDLADLSLEFRAKGRNMRIATKYKRLVKRFLNEKGLNYFSIVNVSGGLEAAPVMGYADLIADISASGATLKANNLRPLNDGIVLTSNAILVANKKLLAVEKPKLEITKMIIKYVQSYLISRQNVTDIKSTSQTTRDPLETLQHDLIAYRSKVS